MFCKFCRKIVDWLRANNRLYRTAAFLLVVFLMLQCYDMSHASYDGQYQEVTATIGDATWTSALPQNMSKNREEEAGETLQSLESGDNEELDEVIQAEETGGDKGQDENLQLGDEEVWSASSDRYRISPDMNQPFVAYAMTMEQGAGAYSNNMCATYLAKVLNGYYGEKAPVAGATLVSQISKALNASENWERVYAKEDCFPKEKTEAEYDAIFDSLTNAGDVVCFVDKSLDNYKHCAIAGGGVSLIGHLYSSGWDSLRSCYYIDNAVDTRKECSGMIVYRYKEVIRTGTIRICKSYDETAYKWNREAYDVAGANYAVYASREDAQAGKKQLGYCYIEPGDNDALAEDNVSANAMTKPNNQGELVQFTPGTYYVKEYSVPTRGGWELDKTVYETKIEAGKRTTLGIPKDSLARPLSLKTEGELFDRQTLGPEKPITKEFALYKSVSDQYQDLLSENDNYDYAGIEYGVYSVDGDGDVQTSKQVGRFEMEADGTGIVRACSYDTACIGKTKMRLPIGWYMIQETKTNTCMELDTTPKWICIDKNSPALQTVTMKDNPGLASADLILCKYGPDKQAVEGAEYEVKYYTESISDSTALADKKEKAKWIFKTDANGEIHYSDDPAWFVEGDAFYHDAAGKIAIPAGTLAFQEITAPEGYLLDNSVYLKVIKPNEEASLSADNVLIISEEKIRGDLSFRKISEDGTPLADVAFSITDELGESHIVWTDEDGYYSTSSNYIPHTKETNSDKKGNGIWFGEDKVDDGKGALPYGHYVIRELRCDANRNKYCNIEDQRVDITKNGDTLELGEWTDQSFPMIQTKAWYDETLIDFEQENQVIEVIDTVTCSNLEVGHVYTLTGQPHTKPDGAVLMQEKQDVPSDKDSGTISAQETGAVSEVTESVVFTAEQEEMEIKVPFSIRVTDELVGKEIVFFEILTDSAYPNEIIAQHADIEDINQTIRFPEPEITTETTTEITTETTTEITTEITTETTTETTTEVSRTTTEFATPSESVPQTPIVAGKSYEKKAETSVRTGDDSQLFVVIMIGSITFFGIGALVIGRYRQKRKSESKKQ